MADVPYIEDAGQYSYGNIIRLPYFAQIRIGKFCSIADGVEFNAMGDHNINWLASYPFHNIEHWSHDKDLEVLQRKHEIVIGNDVWIGYGVKILHGVAIGDGAAIGAYAVVAKDVRPYAVVVGNPAQETKRRFSDDVVDALLEIKWWDWPEEKIRKNLDILLSPDIEALKKAASGD
jgi:acetyltransferase-like isoleucine patch superfamily enzyme